jgi:hypothetical protein
MIHQLMSRVDRLRRLLAPFFVTLLLTSILTACLESASQAQGVSCPASGQWATAANGAQVNYPHIFCGELRDGQLRGFHARPNGQNPSTVSQFSITQSANAQGIYAGQWTSASASHLTKFSTLFPDHCSTSQVINSIAHANANRTTCPAGAPSWAWCGQNRPSNATSSGQYCLGRDGNSFIIAGANLSDGRINTGFPIRQ